LKYVSGRASRITHVVMRMRSGGSAKRKSCITAAAQADRLPPPQPPAGQGRAGSGCALLTETDGLVHLSW
jgi:hypothetical protein